MRSRLTITKTSLRASRWVAGAAIVLGLTLAFVIWPPRDYVAQGASAPAKIDRQPKSFGPEILNLPQPDLFRPLSEAEAIGENSARPFSNRPDSPAHPFRLLTDGENRTRALECLAQAIYYEAGGEGRDGGRAVAQVVLNRVRHPAYPASICGVVYQGAERPTGCQFTFTCDGSLSRHPARHLWVQAREMASEALSGKVLATVGHATHFHANYVVPYWADSLDKSASIGRHIFYRFKGTLGAASVFRQPYAGTEPLPVAQKSLQQTQEGIEQPADADGLLAALDRPETIGARSEVAALLPVISIERNLLADIKAGSLIADSPSPPHSNGSRTKQETCRAQGVQQLRPLGPNAVRTEKEPVQC